ncbi:hypothetical protein J4468_03445 [Candidatus Woesearchaeota archaeon]|nr:hypothetical protein [Candidatus Woesearchaeota archaeon]
MIETEEKNKGSLIKNSLCALLIGGAITLTTALAIDSCINLCRTISDAYIQMEQDLRRGNGSGFEEGARYQESKPYNYFH